MQIRKATMNDLPDILAIYAYAREYMKEHGNPDQWKDNYPPLELTTQDIRSGCLHVCIIRANDRERIGGVFYFHPEEDPEASRLLLHQTRDIPYHQNSLDYCFPDF